MDIPKFTLTDDDIITVYLSSNSTKNSGVNTSISIDEKRAEENDVYDGSDDDGDSQQLILVVKVEKVWLISPCLFYLYGVSQNQEAFFYQPSNKNQFPSVIEVIRYGFNCA